MNRRQQEAIALLHAGLSIVPIRPDGTKAATVKWERYQDIQASEAEVRRWFVSMHSGIAIIGGAISGGLEILDFDETEVFQPWANLVNQIQDRLVETLPIVKTPTGGYHVYYRAAHVARNQKLARRKDDGKIEVRIETRGEGGYVLSPSSHPDCHALKQPYVLIQGDLTDIPLIADETRELLLNAARAFDEHVEPPKRTYQPSPVKREGDERPGDVFEHTHTWHDILEPHGWKAVLQRDKATYWKRPHKDDQGWSASTNYGGRDVFHIFTTNAYPFEENVNYRKFTVWVMLNYRGDFHAAAKALVQERTHGRQAVSVSR